MIKKKESTTNLIIDSVSFVVFLGLLSTGGLLYYRLPPGSGRRLAILGLTRHNWGEIHFWFGVVFLVLMIIHLLCHRGWIARTFFIGRSNSRRFTVSLVLLLLIAAAAIPCFLPVKPVERFSDEGRSAGLSIESDLPPEGHRTKKHRWGHY